MKKLILFLLITINSIVIYAQDIDKKYLVNNWKLLKMGESELPAELTMILKISDSTITMGSQESVSSWNYKLGENNSIILVLEDGNEEKWIIKKLNENELVFNEGSTGDFYLEKTDEDLPAFVAPVIEEEIIEEPAVFLSIETDYKASKKTEKLLIGIWNVETVSGIAAPDGASLSVEFKKDKKIRLTANGTEIEKGSWKIGKDGKKIEVKNPDDDSEELWGIKTLDKNSLVLLDLISGEIVMKRAKKAKK